MYCTYLWVCNIRIHSTIVNACNVIQDPPPINDVTTSTNRAPSDLSGFDIFIMWTVSEFVYVTRHEKTGLCTQNTPIHITVCISFTV